ncbi:hypothetical protein [Novipirellula rosea]|uniref:hypothetical protein n=1 Tax=Novipirellula rosea TaxID=1031540 RepID=UPI0031E99FD2
MPQVHSLKTRSNDKALNRYEALRLQLAEIAIQFFEAARHSPGVHFQLLQADHNMGSDGWSRELDEWHEFLDVYPATWASSNWTHDDLVYMEGQTSQFCGLYKSVSGNLLSAIPEFKRLSERANSVLLALKQEADRHPKLGRFASFGQLCPGNRGWLDSVIKTAALNRNAYVDVKPRIFGVPDDLPSVIRAMGSRKAEAALDRGLAPPCGVVTFEISPDVFTASGNAIRLWLHGGIAENVFSPTYDFEPICIPCSGSSDEATEVFRTFRTPLPSIPCSSKPRRPKKRGRTGLSEQERKEDRRVLESWMTEEYKTYVELASTIGCRPNEVKKRIEREQKRRQRARLDAATLSDRRC